MAFQDGKLFYLAAPYSHKDPAVIEQRMELYAQCELALIKQGVHTVSPLAKHFSLVKKGLPGDWNFWGEYSKLLLLRCDHMIILMMDGWDCSTGVLSELDLCDDHEKPYTYINPFTLLDGFQVEEVLINHW